MTSSENQPDSLVKYGTKILVNNGLGQNDKKNKKKKSQQLNPLEKAGTTRNEDYLNSILPPREYTEFGQLWVRYVSPTPATKVDVMNLQDELDSKRVKRGARDTGICPIREELFAQCFDELIRQITINCAERGFLLVRARDEIKMTIQAYQTLYESSIAYGMRKALIAEQWKNQMSTQIKNLEDTYDSLLRTNKQMEQEIEDMIKKDEEERISEDQEHEGKVNFLKELTADYKNDLEKQLSAPTNAQK